MIASNEESSAPVSIYDDASQALFRLGRVFGRLPMREVLAARTDRGVELSSILVVQAVAVAERAGRAVTVGALAAELGVDPSTASRLASQAVRGGLLRRVAVQDDSRFVRLELTEAGDELRQGAARYQRAVFDEATNGWSDAERQEFARLFVAFADAVAARVEQERHHDREGI